MIKKISIYFFLLLCVFKGYAQHNDESKNNDESKVPTYVLPEVLKAADGSKIISTTTWERKRRPEILKLFENNVYGQVPVDYDSIKFKVTHDVANVMDGKAHLKEVTITVWRINKSVAIHLTLFTPAHSRPSPVFLLINNRPQTNTDASRSIKSEFWPAEMVIDSGYAIAAFQVNDASPDNKDTYQNGVLQLYPEQLSAANGMKGIGAWAWAASRVMDYFKTDMEIDFNRVNVVGHSRGGKTALWAGAKDPRFAMIFASCSGNTGAALSRRSYGETVKRINTVFPYWFTDNYKKYNDNVNALPIDQHMLIALLAPRPVYTTNATEDTWADPKGSYLSLTNAQSVYNLYKKHSALTPQPPPAQTPIINSIIGYHLRTGIHNLTTYDWVNFIRFANFHYHKP